MPPWTLRVFPFVLLSAVAVAVPFALRHSSRDQEAGKPRILLTVTRQDGYFSRKVVFETSDENVREAVFDHLETSDYTSVDYQALPHTPDLEIALGASADSDGLFKIWTEAAGWVVRFPSERTHDGDFQVVRLNKQDSRYLSKVIWTHR